MKLKLDFKLYFHIVLLYPLALAIISALGKEPFFITAPYFILLMLLMGVTILFRKKTIFSNWDITQLFFLGILVIVTLYNFSTFRYSLPIIFSLYIFILHIFLSKYSNTNHYTDFKYYKHYFLFYIFLSVFTIIVPFSDSQRVFRFEGFLGSPTVYSAFLVLLYILAFPSFKKNINKIFWYSLVFLFVLLSKTRLVLLLMILLPLIYIALEKWNIGTKKVFIITFLTLLFLYPSYKIVVDYFPDLVTIRYQKGKDRSYDLRFYLYSITQEEFLRQDVTTQIFGQGNENSRLFIKRKLKEDIYPHNDFIRVVNDWGIIGAIIFFIIIYRYGIRSRIALIVVIMYLIQFYSNLVFNLFLISILVGVSTLSKTNKKIKNE